MAMQRSSFVLSLITVIAGAACGDSGEPESPTPVDESAYVKVLDDKGDASAEAIFLDFTFDGELVTDSSWNPNRRVEEQLLYTIGHLNGDNSVGDLNKLKLSNVTTEAVNGRTVVRYTAELLVAWGDKDNPVTSYNFQLPRDVSTSGLEAFATKYGRNCVDWGAHDVTAGDMWYYYRPARCTLADDDIVRITASAEVSAVNTTGKYPEYHKVWEDDAFKVVAVFGKYEDHATSYSDAGISAYNRFVSVLRTELARNGDVVTTPETVPSSPGVEMPDITFRTELADGTTVEVVALLVDNVRTAGRDFDQRYSELTPDADLIVYNGHAGLGANIQALASKGVWATGQYSIVFMNGCDTYAYVDSALADARAAVNDDDETGTKYLDIITNAMPSFFHEMPNGTMALIRALLDRDQPKTYEQIFEAIDAREVVIVSGEHDNEFVPGGGGEPDVAWEGLSVSGEVAAGEEHRYETPVLPAGTYTFALGGTGDADLYVSLGQEPTESHYDCRPFRVGSAETCVVEVSSPAPVHVMVRGWAAASAYSLDAE